MKKLLFKLHEGLLQAKTANVGVKLAAQDADRENTVEHQEALLVDTINDFKVSELARRAAQKKGFASVADECAGDGDVQVLWSSF